MKRTLLAFILGALLALIVDLASAQSPSPTPTKTAVTFIGGKSIRPRRTASSPISVRAIVPRFFTAIMRRKKSPRPRKKNWYTQESSISRLRPKSCRSRNFIGPKPITKNTISRTRSTLKRSKRALDAFRFRRRRGTNRRESRAKLVRVYVPSFFRPHI